MFDFFLDSSPLQYLPSIPGYVPVYIRYGDEPLEDINPDLAEAFADSSNSIKVLDGFDSLRTRSFARVEVKFKLDHCLLLESARRNETASILTD